MRRWLSRVVAFSAKFKRPRSKKNDFSTKLESTQEQEHEFLDLRINLCSHSALSIAHSTGMTVTRYRLFVGVSPGFENLLSAELSGASRGRSCGRWSAAGSNECLCTCAGLVRSVAWKTTQGGAEGLVSREEMWSIAHRSRLVCPVCHVARQRVAQGAQRFVCVLFLIAGGAYASAHRRVPCHQVRGSCGKAGKAAVERLSSARFARAANRLGRCFEEQADPHRSHPAEGAGIIIQSRPRAYAASSFKACSTSQPAAQAASPRPGIGARPDRGCLGRRGSSHIRAPSP
jgi:hypothetical protein